MEPRRNLSEALRALKDNVMSELNVALPASIESYIPSLRQAAVLPTIKRKYLDGTEEEMPVIKGVPVSWPCGGGGSLTMPLARGDTGLLIFSDRSLDRWLTQGSIAAPDDRRKHALSDAIFIPGISPFNSLSPQDNNDDVLLKYNLAEIRITKAGKFSIKKGPTELLGLVDELMDEAGAIAQALALSTVTTSLGPMPLLNAADFTAIAAKITAIQTKLGQLLE